MARLSDYPQQLRASTEHPEVIYERADDYYAVHGEPRRRGTKDAAVLSLNEGAITVHKGKPVSKASNARETDKVSAVYSNRGALAVPTGQVFVRFASDVDAASQRDSLETAGYAIAQTLSYAPNAAWLKPKDDNVAAALSNIPKLERLNGVENVEPQLIMPRALR